MKNQQVRRAAEKSVGGVAKGGGFSPLLAGYF